MEFQNWKQDPRLRSMDPDKIKQMEQLADQARNTPQDKLLAYFGRVSGAATVPRNSQPQKWTLFFRSHIQMPQRRNGRRKCCGC